MPSTSAIHAPASMAARRPPSGLVCLGEGFCAAGRVAAVGPKLPAFGTAEEPVGAAEEPVGAAEEPGEESEACRGGEGGVARAVAAAEDVGVRGAVAAEGTSDAGAQKKPGAGNSPRAATTCGGGGGSRGFRGTGGSSEGGSPSSPGRAVAGSSHSPTKPSDTPDTAPPLVLPSASAYPSANTASAAALVVTYPYGSSAARGAADSTSPTPELGGASRSSVSGVGSG